MAAEGVPVSAAAVRRASKELYGKKYLGLQHFLDVGRSLLKPIRNAAYNNTHGGKCIFIVHADVLDKT